MDKLLKKIKDKVCIPLSEIDNSGLYMPGEWKNTEE